MEIQWINPARFSVPVTSRALEARVRRKLASDGQKLCKAREGTRAYQDLGRYYIVDIANNTVEASGIDDLEPMARELGLLGEYQSVVRDD